MNVEANESRKERKVAESDDCSACELCRSIRLGEQEAGKMTNWGIIGGRSAKVKDV
jgi:hypothetical protein